MWTNTDIFYIKVDIATHWYAHELVVLQKKIHIILLISLYDKNYLYKKFIVIENKRNSIISNFWLLQVKHVQI